MDACGRVRVCCVSAGESVWVCVCVCVCTCVCMRACVRCVRVCARVCVCAVCTCVREPCDEKVDFSDRIVNPVS